jgi:hypothetical protein
MVRGPNPRKPVKLTTGSSLPMGEESQVDSTFVQQSHGWALVDEATGE